MRRVVIIMNKLAVVLIIAAAVTLLALPAYASLVPMSWGFPTMVQNNSLTNFESNFAWASNNEFSDISFPTSTCSGLSAFSAFPTITQMSNSEQLVSQVKFSNQQQSMSFSYPWISIGFSPVPSMGFL
ncbi:conserved hypothetical protein [Methanocella paludicola SANAE]|uniref:Uncharacterized protein n=2 Tax=Methanocella TaxID=570266 RepID=D1YZ92_METPS|nr:conserved hypothetical protein [Methanocella paludicola SANAE]